MVVDEQPQHPTFGDLLKQHLDRLDWKHGQLAQKIERQGGRAARSTVQSWCSGDATPSTSDLLDQLVLALRLTPEDAWRLREAAWRQRHPTLVAHFGSRVADLEAQLARSSRLLARSRPVGSPTQIADEQSERAFAETQLPPGMARSGRLWVVLDEIEEANPGTIEAFLEFLALHRPAFEELIAAWRQQPVERVLVHREDFAAAVQALARSVRPTRSSR